MTAASAFNLPSRLAAKVDPTLIAEDERQFAAIASSVEGAVGRLCDRLAIERKAPGVLGAAALERDAEIRRLAAQLQALHRFGLDLCLGKIVFADGRDSVYIGRVGLVDEHGRQLLVDWRAPAAEPFFAATSANPMGLTMRRRYRWVGGRVGDYWDERLVDGFDGYAAFEGQSAFVASLAERRSARMRDVLGTIQADQDAIIRSSSRGALVIDGGPGTGKTVVALHRTAYLLYADPRLRKGRGGVLFVGPHDSYLTYVADVLPSLGEDGVALSTVRGLVAEGTRATVEADPEVARLKASADLVTAIEAAVEFYEQPPRVGLTVETDWADLWLSPADWAEAFDAPDPGTPHNEAREQVWEILLDILADDAGTGVPADRLRRALAQNQDLRAALAGAWTLIAAEDLVGDLWSVPAYLRKCAPWLRTDEVTKLRRADPQCWTTSDLPLLDAARRRLGDVQASARRRRVDAAVEAELQARADVTEHLIASDDSEMRVMSMLRSPALAHALVDESPSCARSFDPLAGPFAHVVVDEAQELTDAEWQMLLQRCPSRSFTIAGDRAQARGGFTESWQERLARVGLDRITVSQLSINYRTPREVMTVAEPAIRAALPDANVPESIRSSGIDVRYGRSADLDSTIDAWLDTHADGTACVIGDATLRARPRVWALTPESVKGLEFDLVVVVDPSAFGGGITGAVDRYVAMTRATGELVILTAPAAVAS